MRTRSPNQESHSIVWLLALYLTIVFVGGALIAPWLYFAVQRAAEHFPSWRGLANAPFHRFVHRALLILAVVGLWPFCKKAGIGWRNLGLAMSRAELKRFAGGLCVGFVSLACIAVLVLASGARAFQQPTNIGAVIAIAVGTAIFVAVLEEIIFRGALFGSLKLTYSWLTALLISSAIYALVHFFNNRPAAPAEVTWLSGFFILKEMLRGFVDLHTLIPGFINLTLAGAILAMAYQFTGSLSFSIGLHAGWIFWLKSYGAFTTKTINANEWLWGTTKLIDGWMASLVLIAVLISVGCWLRPRTDSKT
ncbi:MAG: uncharacterized protein JWM68_2253 [Verrucomicrobiales bacterium]|nr:uncharacterized protein [Verrucomicrobiales bacterium]